MNPESVLEKTTKGTEEIETRKHKLDAKLRPILIAVNGKSKAAELMAKFAALGDVSGLLDDMLKQGFVKTAAGSAAATAVADPARHKKAVAEACRFLSDALGPGADPINEKLEQAKTLEELNELLERRRDALEVGLGKAKAAQFWQKIGPLLG